MTKLEELNTCEFCGVTVPFFKVMISDPFWRLDPLHVGAGSDHLATWCHECGPKHRSDQETGVNS